MRNIISASCLVGLVSLLLLSCNLNDSGVDEPMVNEDVLVIVSIKASSNQVPSAGRTTIDSITINQASLGVSRLNFQLQDTTDCESDTTEVEPDSLDVDEGSKVEGPFTFDLVAGTSTPGFEVTPGVYKGVVLKLAPILPDGNSIFIAFQADSTIVEFSSSTPRSFGIHADSTGFLFDDSTSNVLVLFHLEALFADIDLSNATVDEDGVIRINKTSNKGLHNKINSNLGKAFKAGEDDDDDGDID